MDYNVEKYWVEWYNKRLKKKPNEYINDVLKAINKALSESENFDSVPSLIASYLGDYKNIGFIIGSANGLTTSFTLGGRPGSIIGGTFIIPSVDYLYGFNITFTAWNTNYSGVIYVGLDKDRDDLFIYASSNQRTGDSYQYSASFYHKEGEGGRK